jgi:hypothetical protein
MKYNRSLRSQLMQFIALSDNVNWHRKIYDAGAAFESSWMKKFPFLGGVILLVS